jgi:hypothetical protein
VAGLLLSKFRQETPQAGPPRIKIKVLRIIMRIRYPRIHSGVESGQQPPPATHTCCYIQKRQAVELFRGKARARCNRVIACAATRITAARLNEFHMDEQAFVSRISLFILRSPNRQFEV